MHLHEMAVRPSNRADTMCDYPSLMIADDSGHRELLPPFLPVS